MRPERVHSKRCRASAKAAAIRLTIAVVAERGRSSEGGEEQNVRYSRLCSTFEHLRDIRPRMDSRC